MAHHAPTTYKGEKSRLEAILRRWGPKPICAVTPGDVQDFLTELATERELVSATINRYAAALACLFVFAVDKGWARSNPAKAVQRQGEDVRPVPFVSDDDVRLLEAHAGGEAFRTFIRILADTGLRSGEARALEWRDVDFARGVVLVRRSKNHRPREVPLTAAAVDAFQTLQDARGSVPLRGRAPVWPALLAVSAGAVSGPIPAACEAGEPGAAGA